MRNYLISLFLALNVVTANFSPASAQAGIELSPEVQIVVQLIQDEGFEIRTMQFTWLGRLRIIADRLDYEREIVLNPRSGEILRDITRLVRVPTVRPAGSGGGGGGGGGGGSDDDDDDDDDSGSGSDDDDDDDYGGDDDDD